MTGLNIRNTKDKIIFSIDKNNFTKEDYIKLMQIARVEYLVQKADFNKAILDFGEELKSNWWNAHKESILNRIDK